MGLYHYGGFYPWTSDMGSNTSDLIVCQTSMSYAVPVLRLPREVPYPLTMIDTSSNTLQSLSRMCVLFAGEQTDN